ncbi:MAG TPA: helix-turn-helix transcriptional regulator [Acidimicrobiia bacterium]
MVGTAQGTGTATAWWKVVGAATARGDFGAIEAEIARVRDTSSSPGAQSVIWTATGSLAGLRGELVEAEVAFVEALRYADLSDDGWHAGVARISRAECMALVTPARSIEDARHAIVAGSTGSRAILHQARMALIAGHRAAGDVAIAIGLGERVLADDLSPLNRGRALGGHAMSLIAADRREDAVLVLARAIPIFEELGTEWFTAVTEMALARVDPSRYDELYRRSLARAGRFADDPAWRRVLDGKNAPELAPTSGVPSARELVIALVARGFTTRQVADALLIQPSTVESHVRRSMLLTGATTRAQLVGSRGTCIDGGAPSMNAEERELLDFVAAGCTTKEIAVRLHLSTRTVTRRLRALRERFRVASTPALVAAATS